MELSPHQWENVKTLFEEALGENSCRADSVSGRGRAGCRRATARSSACSLTTSNRAASFPIPRTSHFGRDASVAPPAGVSIPARRSSSPTVSASRAFIARGGMGEVYEAEDVELHERVALKSIRGELLHNAKALDRFKREVHLARKVTHPERLPDLRFVPAGRQSRQVA